MALAFAAPGAFAQPEFRYHSWHGHSRPPHIKRAGEMGTLVITDAGVAFAGSPKHTWRWAWEDIEQLKLAPASVTVLTYRGNKWKPGADREYRFDLLDGKTPEGAYAYLKGRLDQRLVAEMPDRAASALWEIPVKRLLRFGGEQGVLQVSASEIVYKSAARDESRTWRYQDIDNISSSGPFQLTVTSFERAAMHYGDRKGFNFELRQPLDEARYNDLWLRLERARGLQILDSYRQGKDND
jgi:hypothetical protein